MINDIIHAGRRRLARRFRLPDGNGSVTDFHVTLPALAGAAMSGLELKPWRIGLGICATVAFVAIVVLAALTYESRPNIANSGGGGSAFIVGMAQFFANYPVLPLASGVLYVLIMGFAVVLSREVSFRSCVELSVKLGIFSAALLCVGALTNKDNWQLFLERIAATSLCLVFMMSAANALFCVIAGLPWRSNRRTWG